MRCIPVSELPKRNSQHKLQDFISKFLTGSDDIVLVDFKKNDYKSAKVCCSCLHTAVKRSRSRVKVHIRGNCVYLEKNSPALLPDVREYKNDAITAAKDLNYGLNVILQLEKATHIGEIEHIMASSRKGEIH